MTLSRIVNGLQNPDDQTVQKLADALAFPRAFFFRDDIDAIDVSAASFRSLTSMTARERDAALASGSLAYEVVDWVRSDFNLPSTDLVDLSHERDPAGAARTLRQAWSIGEKPISSMIKLLETKGVRVFSLAENTKNVDAFSCWRTGEPYVFLNTFKSAERSRFDAAHELAHLVLHKHGGPKQGRSAELEAHAFAASFLMPSADILSTIPFAASLDQIIRAKKRWGVSVAALCHRLHRLKIISDWQYRTFCIQINRRFSNYEPDGLPPERSTVWKTILVDLWRRGLTRADVAEKLDIPHDELENLLFGLTGDVAPPERAVGSTYLTRIK